MPVADPEAERGLLQPASAPTSSAANTRRKPKIAIPPRRAAADTTSRSGGNIVIAKAPKSGRLVIERDHASTGAISGALPTMAASVSAYPADLTAAGITLYTADPRYAKPLTEKPGAQNGWNPTTYMWDPKRAAGIKIIEQPGPQNGYKLVLQSDLSKLSVVVLEWRATQ